MDKNEDKVVMAGLPGWTATGCEKHNTVTVITPTGLAVCVTHDDPNAGAELVRQLGASLMATPHPLFKGPQVHMMELKIDANDIVSMMQGTDRAMMSVIAERLAQNEQWGGPEHDDTHTGDDWLSFIGKQQLTAVNETLSDNGLEVMDPEGYRARLVKIAALAFAAIESHDRKHGAPAVEAKPHERFAQFDKHALMNYIDAAMPEKVGIREFVVNYWAPLDESGNAADAALQRAQAATREFGTLFAQASTQSVGFDFTDSSITLTVGA